MFMPRHWRSGTIISALLSSACGNDSASPRAATAPLIESSAIARSAENVLSGIVSVSVRDADSVAVRFRLAGAGAEADSVTPAAAVVAGWITMPVLGLLPAREYELRVVAYGRGGTIVGPPFAFLTDPLPADLPSYSAAGDNPSPGYIAMAAGVYGLVIDNTGRVVWYHRFPNGPWLNFMAQPNGHYVARLVTADPTDVESWVELDPLGNVTRILGCRLGLQARFHDLIVEPDGAYWILCDDARTMDLSEVGGAAAARVTGTSVQHVSRAGELLFRWTPFDHFRITDVDSMTRSGSSVNWTHGNSLDFDRQGNLLVSFRNLNEITNIDARSGEVLWRLGGLRNEFTFSDGARPFAGQHSIRALPSGEFVLLDNIGDTESRVEQWAVDASTRVARMTASYGSSPQVRTLIGGSVQRLSTTRTLVSFGTEGRVEEYDAAGTVLWRLGGTPGYVFRAQRFPSLYRPGVGISR